MTSLLCLFQAIHSLTTVTVPAGTPLQIRTITAVASWSSPVGAPVRAMLIAPVILANPFNNQLACPLGSALAGEVRSVTRVGLGIRHERASIELAFNTITLPGGESFPIDAQVAQVDNGRERMTSSGKIEGVRATNSLSYRVCGYLKMMLLWHFHEEVIEWAIKSLVVQLPESEIYFPEGTELTLRVASPVLGRRSSS